MRRRAHMGHAVCGAVTAAPGSQALAHTCYSMRRRRVAQRDVWRAAHCDDEAAAAAAATAGTVGISYGGGLAARMEVAVVAAGAHVAGTVVKMADALGGEAMSYGGSMSVGVVAVDGLGGEAMSVVR